MEDEQKNETPKMKDEQGNNSNEIEDKEGLFLSTPWGRRNKSGEEGKNSTDSNSRRATEVSMSTPWGGTQYAIEQGVWGKLKRRMNTTDKFIEERTRLHETYIKELEKTKRIGLILSACLITVAVIVITFAPQGREEISYWVGGALVITAAGAAGYKRVWGNSKLFSVGASGDNDPKIEQ